MSSTITELRILRNELLEAHRELTRLRIQNEQLMASNRDLSTLLVTTEGRSGELVKIIVAFRRLLEAQDSGTALRSVEEILINVIGTEDFAVLLIGESDRLLVVGGMGPTLKRSELVPPSLGTLDATELKVIPLYILENLVGVIVIDHVLPHRDPLNANDDQVLTLLSRFAATAIMAAEHKKHWTKIALAEVS